MPKVILHISYEIPSENRDAYLALARELKAHFAVEQKKNYSLFEVRGKKNAFIEQFVCESMEAYEALEDDMNEKSEALVARLNGLLKNGKAKYSTLVELA